MNPNDPNNLDPKLRETYERIMGTPPAGSPPLATQQTAGESQNPPQAQQPQQTQPVPRMQTEQVTEPQPPPTLTPPPLQQDDITQSPLSSGTFVNPNPSASEVVEGDSPVKPEKKNNLMPIVLTIGILVFFAVYAVIWSKVFGLF